MELSKDVPTELSDNVKSSPSSIDVVGDEAEERRIAMANYVPGTKKEKLLVRKVDLIMIPMLWWMCVLAYVDRNNIGNAKAAGMNDSLGLDDQGYSMLISIFFIGYVVWEVPSNIVMARTRPSLYLPGLMVIWGALVTGMSQAKNSKDILVYRFFLGVVEAGFLPGVMYLMSCWYKKSEIGKRFSIFFTALCVAGAVSGLISGAVISGLEGTRGMEGWRWLFLIEGVLTVLTGMFAVFVLPDYPDTTRRLNLEERQLAAVRILQDKHATTAQATRSLTSWQSIKAAVCDLRTYFFAILYFLDNGSTTISYFIPTVLSDMGYQGVKAQWMTVPIWMVGTVFLLILPQSSDRTGDRRWHIAGGLAMSFVSAVISATVLNSAVRYTFICFYISGLYSTLPLILSWGSEVIGLPAEKRAVVIAMVNCIGNLSAIYGSQLWPSEDGPRYVKGFAAVAAFAGFSALLSAAGPLIFRWLPSFPTKAERELAEEEQAASPVE